MELLLFVPIAIAALVGTFIVVESAQYSPIPSLLFLPCLAAATLYSNFLPALLLPFLFMYLYESKYKRL